MSLADCLNAVIVSLLDNKAILTTEAEIPATIGVHMVTRGREFRDFLTAWMGEGQS